MFIHKLIADINKFNKMEIQSNSQSKIMDKAFFQCAIMNSALKKRENGEILLDKPLYISKDARKVIEKSHQEYIYGLFDKIFNEVQNTDKLTVKNVLPILNNYLKKI